MFLLCGTNAQTAIVIHNVIEGKMTLISLNDFLSLTTI